MEDEGQRAEEIDRGNKAKVILSDPLFQEAFDQLRELYMNAWEQTTIKDSDTRERLWMMIANLGDVKACLLYTSPSPRDLSTSRMPSSA